MNYIYGDIRFRPVSTQTIAEAVNFKSRNYKLHCRLRDVRDFVSDAFREQSMIKRQNARSTLAFNIYY